MSYYADLAYSEINIKFGLFVDVGAYRPISLSNSYAFYKLGWKCINIDATPGTMKIFDRVRPSDINLEVAVGPADSEATYYLFGNPSVFNTMDPEMAERHRLEQNLGPPAEIPIKVRRLDSLLAEYGADLPFEVLNVDVEGFDLEVLQSNDFSRFRPRVILVEAHGCTVETLADSSVFRFLKPLGYNVRAWLNPTVMFVRT